MYGANYRLLNRAVFEHVAHDTSNVVGFAILSECYKLVVVVSLIDIRYNVVARVGIFHQTDGLNFFLVHSSFEV